MISMNLITLLIVVVTWGSLILEIFLLINFYAAGSISKVYACPHSDPNSPCSIPTRASS